MRRQPRSTPAPDFLFIDYLRDGRGTTAVGAYSPRAREDSALASAGRFLCVPCLVLKTRYFVFQQQLAAFQLNDFQIIDPRVSTGFSNFYFQGPMPSFQFRKMRFCRHTGSPEPMEAGWLQPGSEPSTRVVVCHSCMQSRVCLATGKL